MIAKSLSAGALAVGLTLGLGSIGSVATSTSAEAAYRGGFHGGGGYRGGFRGGFGPRVGFRGYGYRGGYGYRRGFGAPIAAGLGLGLLTGAVVGSSFGYGPGYYGAGYGGYGYGGGYAPGYYGAGFAPVCTIRYRPVFDGYGYVRQPVRVCH